MPGPIGYTVRFVRAKLDKRRAVHGGGTEQPPHEDDDIAAADPRQLDEESFGKDASPAATGIPADPGHARTKRASYRAMVVMGFGLAIDYTMSLMSIQPLYYTLSGPQSLYGLTFGAYDLSAMLFAPLFGLWTDRTGTFKVQVLTGAVLNACGNLVYAFTFLGDAWWMLLLARLVAGAGEATLGIGSSYVTQTTTSARRQVALGRYRVTQSIARMVGPFCGYLFLGLPNVSSSSSTALKIFNWYTVPGWAAFVLVVALLAGFAVWFEDPTEENEHRTKPDALAHGDCPPSAERAARFRRFSRPWLALSFFTVFAASGFTSNLFALFAGQYHQVTSQQDNWMTYIGVGCGAMAAGFIFRRAIRWWPQWWEERKISLASQWLLLVMWLLIIPYGGATWVPPEALFYIATTLSGFLVVVNQASIETVFSKKLTQYADVVGERAVGQYMSAYFMAASAGRFAGPLVVAGVTKIATPWGETGYCTQWETGPDGAEECVGPWDQQCVITGDQYWVGGCVLYHAIPMFSAMAGLQLFLCLAFHAVLREHWSWGDESGGGSGGSAAAVRAAGDAAPACVGGGSGGSAAAVRAAGDAAPACVGGDVAEEQAPHKGGDELALAAKRQ